MDTDNGSDISLSEDYVLKGLALIGYSGTLTNTTDLYSVIEAGLKDKEYSNLVQFLTNELRTLLIIDEDINSLTSLEDSTAFVLIITSFLRELQCPFESLTGGVVSERLTKYSERLMLLDYLVNELMIARILQEKKPEKKIELKFQEAPEASDMRQILQTLRFPKPPSNITAKQLFDKIETTVPLVLKKAKADLVGTGIFNGSLSPKRWDVLKGVQNDFHNEYSLRREMLLMRLDVTIQSFQWSDKTKGSEQSFEKVYFDKRKALSLEPDVDLSALLAARTDIAIYEKISSTSVRKNTRTHLNKVIIGQVPDRGGRSSEQKPPPPEMPSWAPRNASQSGDFSRGGGRGGQSHRGGRESRGSGGRGGSGRGGGGYEGRGSGGYEARGKGGYRSEESGYQGRSSGNSYDTNRGYSNGDDNQRRYGGSSHYGGRGSEGAGRGGGRSSSSYDRYGGGSYSGYGNDSYNYNRRESDDYIDDYQQNKRPKTYDNFQAEKTTYAEQYVQESQHNQQYHRGRGRDNYQRGRGYHKGGGFI